MFGPHRVAPVGEDRPSLGGFVPLGGVDRRVEQAFVVETERGSHRLAILEDLETRRELHCRDVVHLLEQREIAVALDVARYAGVPIPVPRPADVAALLAEADVLETGLAKSVPQQQTCETCTDDQDLAFVGERIALDRVLGVDVFEVRRKFPLERHVVSSASSGFFELAVLGLFVCVKDRAWWLLRQCKKRLVFQHAVAGTGDLLAGFGRSCSEYLEPSLGVNADRIVVHIVTPARWVSAFDPMPTARTANKRAVLITEGEQVFPRTLRNLIHGLETPIRVPCLGDRILHPEVPLASVVATSRTLSSEQLGIRVERLGFASPFIAGTRQVEVGHAASVGALYVTAVERGSDTD